MSSDTLQPIRDALKAGDKPSAQTLLRPLLKGEPTADVWYLAAQACLTDEKAIVCLRKALVLQPQHSGANRLLYKLEGPIPPQAVAEQPSIDVLVPDEALKKVRRKKKRSGTRTVLLISLVALAMSCSLVTMNMVGLITGPVTVMTELTGGATPVSQIDGQQLSQVTNAPLLVEPSQTKPLAERDADVIEPGYTHEYTFSGYSGTNVAVYVQFLSLAANRVSRNVVVLRPDNSDATGNCQRDTILQGDNNVTLTCPVDSNGIWKVRILGRAGESVGVYFVGVETLES